MSSQKGDWRIVGQVATGFSNNLTVRVQPVTWEEFLGRQVGQERKTPWDPSASTSRMTRSRTSRGTC